jgi:hypothetical protein
MCFSPNFSNLSLLQGVSIDASTSEGSAIASGDDRLSSKSSSTVTHPQVAPAPTIPLSANQMMIEDGLLQKPSLCSGPTALYTLYSPAVHSARSPEPQSITAEHQHMLSMVCGPAPRCSSTSFSPNSPLTASYNIPSFSSSFSSSLNTIALADRHRLGILIQQTNPIPPGTHPFSARAYSTLPSQQQTSSGTC